MAAKKATGIKTLPNNKVQVFYDDGTNVTMTSEQARLLGLAGTPEVTSSVTGTTVTAGSYGTGQLDTAFTDTTTGGVVAGTGVVPTKGGPKTIGQLIAESKNPKNLAAIRNNLLKYGLISKGTKSLTSIQNAWLQVLIGSSTSQLDPEDYMKQLKAGGFGPDVGATGPSTTQYPSIYSDTQAKAKITEFFQKNLRRDPTAEELKTFIPEIQTAQAKNPAVQTYKTVAGKKVQTTKGGLDEEQWFIDKLNASDTYKKELETVGLVPSDVAQRVKDKEIYDKALAAAGKDQLKIDKLESTTAYGLALRGLKNKIRSALEKAGASFSEGDIATWAKEAYDINADADTATLTKFIDSKSKFGDKGFKGEALTAFNDLRDTALANGLDINKTFGSQIPGWLTEINKGANVDEFKQRIREIAKIGMPERIGKLLDQGIDLKTIYSPYQNVMESVLELPSGSITLNDPTLRGAITNTGEVPIYEFERQLRNDPRWGFTDTARQQVSSTALDILRQFGFQG